MAQGEAEPGAEAAQEEVEPVEAAQGEAEVAQEDHHPDPYRYRRRPDQYPYRHRPDQYPYRRRYRRRRHRRRHHRHRRRRHLYRTLGRTEPKCHQDSV